MAVDLSDEIHPVEHREESGIEAIPGAFDQPAGLNPEIGLQGLGVFPAGFAHVHAILPGLRRDLPENFLPDNKNEGGGGRGFSTGSYGILLSPQHPPHPVFQLFFSLVHIPHGL